MRWVVGEMRFVGILQFKVEFLRLYNTLGWVWKVCAIGRLTSCVLQAAFNVLDIYGYFWYFFTKGVLKNFTKGYFSIYSRWSWTSFAVNKKTGSKLVTRKKKKIGALVS